MKPVLCLHCKKSYPPGTLFCPDDGFSFSVEVLQITPGMKVGEYLIEKKLGEGGMGEVWSGKHPQIGKQVAIKILSQNMIANPKAVVRFIQEARAVNEIQHRNIVDIFAFGELSDGRPYFVMERLFGQSLSAYLAENGPLSSSVILLILEQLCSALQAAHELNITHRDLKPDNIFLSFPKATDRHQPALFVKILDFGIAKLNPANGTEKLTGTGAVIGTPPYMSPEQCEGSKKVDKLSDLYSVGIILFELLTGRTPFYEPGEGIGVILSKHLFMPTPALSSMVSNRNIPAEVEVIARRMLSKKPSDRYLSALDFYDALAAVRHPWPEESQTSLQKAKPLYGVLPAQEWTSEKFNDELAKRISAMPSDSSASRSGDYYSGEKSLLPKRLKTMYLAVASLGLGILLMGVWILGSEPEKKAAPTTPRIEAPASSQAATKSAPSASASAPSTNPAPLPANKPAKKKKKDKILFND